MCGICGVANRSQSNPADESVLRRMNDAMLHRGPDDAGTWLGDHVALGMRRLGIIDLAGGHQPMTNEDGTVVVVFNGEIYNFQEIRTELLARGHVFRTQGDTEVIVHAYEEFGDGAALRFNGMFAFAVYDTRLKRLLVARDRLGIKPLFYAEHPRGLAFASELHALMKSGLVGGELNVGALDAYLQFLYVPAPDTMFAGVRKLLPGEQLVYEQGKVTLARYWRLEFHTDRSWTLDSAAETCRHLMEDAVRLQRVSDVPLGAFLSGGVDSSCVVALLAGMSDHPVKTFTIGFGDQAADETAHARRVAERFATEHTEEILDPGMTQIARDLVRHFGEPFADSSAVPTWLVSRLARRHVTVSLSGDGGDELFAGYTWAHRSLAVARYRAVPAPLRGLIACALRTLPSSPLIGKLRRFSDESFMPLRDGFRRRETCFDAAARATLYGPALRERVATAAIDRFTQWADAGPEPFREWMLHQDTVMYLPDDILTKVDRMSMAHSLEARVPLLDHRLVEFAASLPFGLKYARGVSKRVLKRAMRDLLPAETLRQRKQGFGIPIHRWFREELGAAFKAEVLRPDACCARLLNASSIQTLFDTHASGRENLGHHLWTLLMLEYWMRYVQDDLGIDVCLR